MINYFTGITAQKGGNENVCIYQLPAIKKSIRVKARKEAKSDLDNKYRLR